MTPSPLPALLPGVLYPRAVVARVAAARLAASRREEALRRERARPAPRAPGTVSVRTPRVTADVPLRIDAARFVADIVPRIARDGIASAHDLAAQIARSTGEATRIGLIGMPPAREGDAARFSADVAEDIGDAVEVVVLDRIERALRESLDARLADAARAMRLEMDRRVAVALGAAEAARKSAADAQLEATASATRAGLAEVAADVARRAASAAVSAAEDALAKTSERPAPAPAPAETPVARPTRKIISVKRDSDGEIVELVTHAIDQSPADPTPRIVKTTVKRDAHGEMIGATTAPVGDAS